MIFVINKIYKNYLSMKKKLLLLSIVFFISLLCAWAENVLLLTNPKTGETDAFRKGSFLVFELKADKSVREGFIKDITDSALVFYDVDDPYIDYEYEIPHNLNLYVGQVSLSQIIILAGSTKGKIIAGKVTTAIGNALVLAGLSLFDCGWNLFIYSDTPYYYWPLGGSIWIAGAIVAGMGYALDWAMYPFFHHTIRVRNYRGWDACIVQEEQESKKQTQKQILTPQDSTEQKKTPPKEEPQKKKVFKDDVYGE
jgi:hypothetical protein